MEPTKSLPPPKQLHVFSDKSILRKMSARDLIKIPVWHGNRILNEAHKVEILGNLKNGIRSLDSKLYHLITYPVLDENNNKDIQTFIVDGQHRVSIMKDAFYNESDLGNFDVIVVDKQCSSEYEVVEYFKILNTTKAIEWKEDPILQANRFVAVFERAFNVGKVKLVRPPGSHRPYMATDKLRDAILKQKIYESGKTPEEFSEYAMKTNTEMISYFTANPSPEKVVQRGLALGFCLAADEKFTWMAEFSSPSAKI